MSTDSRDVWYEVSAVTWEPDRAGREWGVYKHWRDGERHRVMVVAYVCDERLARLCRDLLASNEVTP